jgi:zinc D-Ala-D-Ala dipeptidase
VKHISALLCWMLCISTCCSPSFAQIPADSGQLLVVTSKDWSDLHGVAQRYEQRGRGFRKVGAAFAVVVGKTGMGWGRGVNPPAPSDGPVKREGDGKAPAGMFLLGTAFGYEPGAVTHLAYLPLTPGIECVDDAASSHYNQLLDGSAMHRDWHSSEQMRRNDELYHYGIFVEHNTPPVANAGSCIFLHIWEGPDEGTVGCTAMDPNTMQLLLRWFDADKKPLLIQLPQAQYQRLQNSWHLPAL